MASLATTTSERPAPVPIIPAPTPVIPAPTSSFRRKPESIPPPTNGKPGNHDFGKTPHRTGQIWYYGRQPAAKCRPKSHRNRITPAWRLYPPSRRPYPPYRHLDPSFRRKPESILPPSDGRRITPAGCPYPSYWHLDPSFRRKPESILPRKDLASFPSVIPTPAPIIPAPIPTIPAPTPVIPAQAGIYPTPETPRILPYP